MDVERQSRYQVVGGLVIEPFNARGLEHLSQQPLKPAAA
jgi:hypothetical protein